MAYGKRKPPSSGSRGSGAAPRGRSTPAPSSGSRGSGAAPRGRGSQPIAPRSPAPYVAPAPEKFIAPPRVRRSGTAPAARGRAPAPTSRKVQARQERNAARTLKRVKRVNRRIHLEQTADKRLAKRQLLYHLNPGRSQAYTNLDRAVAEGYKKTPAFKKAFERTAERVSFAGDTTPQKLSYQRSGTGAKTGPTKIDLDKVLKPAANILDQTTRPFEVLAGVEKAVIKGEKNPLKIAQAGYESGITREKTVRGRDLVAAVGIKNKTAQNIVGTGLEFAGDPSTYIPVGKAVKGLSSGSRAIRASKRATKSSRFVAPDSTPAQRKAARKATSRKARAAYNRKNPPKRRNDPLDPFRPTRDTASKIIPVRKSDITSAQQRQLTVAGREMRAIQMTESRTSAKAARAVRRKAKGQRTRLFGRRRMKAAQSDRISDAMEANDLSKLTPNERAAAKAARRETERQYHGKRRHALDAGERPQPRYQPQEAGEPVGYVPRVATEDIVGRGTRRRLRKSGQPGLRPARKASPAGSRTRTTTLKDRMRTDRRPAAKVRADQPEVMVRDLETTLQASGQKAAAIQATTFFRGAVKRMGRPIHDKNNITYRSGEDVYEFHTTKTKIELREVKTPKQLNEARAQDLVVLPKPVAREAMGALESAGHHPIIDLPTHLAKFALTVPNPQYWARNLYGGLHNVWQEGMPIRDFPRGIATAARVNRAVARRSRAQELGRPTANILRGRKGAKARQRSQKAPGAPPAPDSGRVPSPIPERLLEADLAARSPRARQLIWADARRGVERADREAGLLRAPTENAIARDDFDKLEALTNKSSGIASRRARSDRTLAQLRELENPAPKPMTKADARKMVNLGKSGKIRLDDLLDEMDAANVTGQGQTVELLGARSAPRHIAQGAEDMPRVTAYLYYRRQGKTPSEASQHVQNSQFDYGQLTKFEKQWARRIMPFYTWRSRNIAFQAKTLVERPGKMANIEKLRDFAAEQSGMPEDWEDKLTRAEALQLPIPIGNKNLAFPALPITDLNMLGTGNPASTMKLWLEQGAQMTNPVFKNPIEMLTNYSFYFRAPLEEPYSKWSKAPPMPGPLAELLSGIGWVRKNDKGELEWRGKAKYLANMIPSTSVASMGATGDPGFSGRAGGWLTGVRVKKYAPLLNRYGKLWDRHEELETELADLSELNLSKDKKGNYTKAQVQTKNEQNKIRWQIQDLSTRLDKDLSEPGTKRGKVYKKGYDPERGLNPGETSADQDAPVWETETPSTKEKRARKKQDKAVWE